MSERQERARRREERELGEFIAAHIYKPHPDPDEPLHLVIDASRGVDGELYDPYPQPSRCKNCGQWILTMTRVGTETCGENCEKAVKERKARNGSRKANP